MLDFGQELRKVIYVMDQFRAAHQHISCQGCMVLLYVHMDSGISVRDLSAKVGIQQAHASRLISSFLKVHRKKQAGLDLLYFKEDPMDRRVKRLYLTSKGEGILRRIDEYFRVLAANNG